MKKLIFLSILLLITLTGCSTNSANKPLDGEGLYKKSCLACHGQNLEGGAFGPPVANMSAKYSEEDILKLINDGIGKMPGKLVSEEEAKLITTWLIEK